MNLKNRIIAFAAATAIIVPAAAMGAFTVKKTKDGAPKASVVKVDAALNLGAGIKGSVEDVTIADNGQDLVVNVGLGRLSTGISMRDTHFKERMAELGASLTVKTSDVKGKKSATVPGKLKLNGVTRPVDVTFTTTEEKDYLKVVGSIKDPKATGGGAGINRKDFGIGKDKKDKDADTFCKAGICAKEHITINAELYVNKG